MLARYDLASGERSRTHVLLPDLHDHADLITEYERHYAPGMAWPEITDSIHRSGIQEMRIYRLGVRLVMVMRTDDDFDFERKAAADAADPAAQRRAALMARYQVVGPDGEKWQRASLICRRSRRPCISPMPLCTGDPISGVIP
ncbi:MAG: L-fucose mutarotase [Sphingomonas sp.]|nr:L-fucose mutarotase [Sphingomonas sp.]